MSMLKFKQLVRNACEDASYISLLKEKKGLSKGSDISYVKNEPPKYLLPGSNLSLLSMRRILQIRIRDLPVRGNFSRANVDTSCPFPLCKTPGPETQWHLMHCSVLTKKCALIQSDTMYEDIFTNDFLKQYIVMKILFERLAMLNHYMNENPAMLGQRIQGVTL